VNMLSSHTARCLSSPPRVNGKQRHAGLVREGD
jgi:hypothetical protein